MVDNNVSKSLVEYCSSRHALQIHTERVRRQKSHHGSDGRFFVDSDVRFNVFQLHQCAGLHVSIVTRFGIILHFAIGRSNHCYPNQTIFKPPCEIRPSNIQRHISFATITQHCNNNTFALVLGQPPLRSDQIGSRTNSHQQTSFFGETLSPAQSLIALHY